MRSRLVDVATHGRHVRLGDESLIVCDHDVELGRVPLADVGAVLLSAHGTSCTTPLLAALAARGVVVVVCGRDHLPAAWLVPVAGHHAQVRLMQAQASASVPFTKRLWQFVVQAKVQSQADVLDVCGRDRAQLDALAPLVRSGDTSNVEARAARLYWPALFGESFRRDRSAPGVNAQLNYGYTVLRAMTARQIVAAGLHPGLSLHHRRDPLALADDLMEPLRGVVDRTVRVLSDEGATDITPSTRGRLVDAVGQVEQVAGHFVHAIVDAYVTGCAPVWGKTHVVTGAVRPANDDHRGAQGGVAVPREAAPPWVSPDSTLGLRTSHIDEGGDLEVVP